MQDEEEDDLLQWRGSKMIQGDVRDPAALDTQCKRRRRRRRRESAAGTTVSQRKREKGIKEIKRIQGEEKENLEK